MLKLKYDEAVVLEKIDAVVRKTLDMDLPWDWPCGVGFYGITRVYEATGKKEYLEMLAGYIDEYVELGLPDLSVNTCAMGHALLTLYLETGEERYKKVLDQKLHYLRHDALRFGDSVLQHTVSANNDFPEQAWADTLMMAAYLMLRCSLAFDDEEMKKDALNQYYWHIEYLQDKASGLWYHGYNNIAKDHMSGFYWGRANAWGAYTMSRVKKVLKDWYLYPPCMDIESSLRDQLAGLKKVQMDDGMWHTILDDDGSYGEISATAGIAAGMVNCDNTMHTKYVQKALDAVLENITEDGRVLNVSAGTAVMKDREGYRNVPKSWAQGWGQGLALALLASVLENGNAE